MNGRKLITTGIVLVVAGFVCLFTAINIESNKLPILMYHNIVADGEKTSSMSVTKSKFENDIKLLADKGYEFLLPSDLLKEDFKLPEKAVMITFDDGYRSNYELAFPILKKYKAKAEISVITEMINENREVFCTWDMLKEMSDSGLVEIGSHTNNCHNPENGGIHIDGGVNGIQIKDGESAEEYKLRVLDDIKLSYDLIKKEIDKAPMAFAYPYGKNDKHADKYIAELFPVSFGTKTGMAHLFRLHKLNRFEIYEDTDIKTYL